MQQSSKAPEPVVLRSGPPRHADEDTAGRIVGGIAVLFLAVDATVKALALPPAVEGTVRLGYPEGVIVGIGIVQLVCLTA